MLTNKDFYVHLRALEPEDLDVLYQIENDTSTWNVSCTNVPYSRYVLHQYMANCVNDIYTDKQVRMVIATPENECIGLLDFVDFNPQHNRAELGFVIQTKYRNKGYAKQALTLALNYAKHTLRLHQVYAIVAKTNELSFHLFQSVGFQNQCMLTDWLFNGEKYSTALLLQCVL